MSQPLSRVEVRPVDLGVVLPRLGLAINAAFEGAPALCTHPAALKPIARQRGVLATAETWTRAFPRRRAARAAAPTDRPLRLGESSVFFVPHPGETWAVHLRILGRGVECVHVTCPPGCPPGLEDMTSSADATLLLVGPLSSAESLGEEALAALRRCWPRAHTVLYGPAVQGLDAPRAWSQAPGVELLKAPVQEDLF
jgi:hypothetical protein